MEEVCGIIPQAARPYTKEEWEQVKTLNASVSKTERDGKLFIQIYLKEGGWLGFWVESALVDMAPFAG